ncbi:MAG: T9SS type A sorting domain-containing protein [Sphingobacteriales bacterium JAD_PAG50586_3]|nr:MAG: T9SS type A sorting domain-containing protein [Sphingobacteriales bacterium JAD_PAG50586_3]
MPESVNDAIYKTIEDINWRPDARKMILVIGDAHSLEPPYGDHSLNDVVKKCISSAVHVNLYPVVISTEDIYGDLAGDVTFTEPEEPALTVSERNSTTPKVGTIIARTYPNPAIDYAYLDLTGTGHYVVDVKSLLGKTISSEEITTNRYTCNLLAVPAGIYLVTVTDKGTGKAEIRQIVKK